MTTPELEAMAAAILAKVPIGYGMTKPEAVDYARAALKAIREPDQTSIRHLTGWLRDEHDWFFAKWEDVDEAVKAYIANILGESP